MIYIDENKLFEKIKQRVPLLDRIRVELNNGFEFQRYVTWPVSSVDRFKLDIMDHLIEQQLDFISAYLPQTASEEELIAKYVERFGLMFSLAAPSSFAHLLNDFRRCDVVEQTTTAQKLFTDNYYDSQSAWKTMNSHNICFVTNQATYNKLKDVFPNDSSIEDSFIWMIVDDEEGSYNDVVYSFNIYDVVLRSVNAPVPIFISNKVESLTVGVNSYISIDSIDEQIIIYKYILTGGEA